MYGYMLLMLLLSVLIFGCRFFLGCLLMSWFFFTCVPIGVQSQALFLLLFIK
jgi:hypothetical protein